MFFLFFDQECIADFVTFSVFLIQFHASFSFRFCNNFPFCECVEILGKKISENPLFLILWTFLMPNEHFFYTFSPYSYCKNAKKCENFVFSVFSIFFFFAYIWSSKNSLFEQKTSIFSSAGFGMITDIPGKKNTSFKERIHLQA